MDVWLGLGIGAVGLLFTIIGFATAMYKQAGDHGREMQALKSENEKQDITIANVKDKLDGLILSCERDKAHNLGQHEEFYKYKDATIRLESDLNYIKQSIGEIKDFIVRAKP